MNHISVFMRPLEKTCRKFKSKTRQKSKGQKWGKKEGSEARVGAEM